MFRRLAPFLLIFLWPCTVQSPTLRPVSLFHDRPHPVPVACSPCVQLTLQGTLKLVSENASRSCSSTAGQPLNFFGDVAHAKNGNPYHISASLFAILALVQAETDHLRLTVDKRDRLPSSFQFYYPQTWSESPWAQTLFLRQLDSITNGLIPVKISYKTRGSTTCVRGKTYLSRQMNPFFNATVLLPRRLMLRACRIDPDSCDPRSIPDVLVLNRQKELVKRTIKNERELKTRLRDAGLTVRPGGTVPTDVCEQVFLVSRPYKLIISPHGAHLTNLIALHPSTHVIEIFPPRHQFPLYCNIARALGQGNRWFQFYTGLNGTRPPSENNCTDPALDKKNGEFYYLPHCDPTAPGFSRCSDESVRDVPLDLSDEDIDAIVAFARELIPRPESAEDGNDEKPLPPCEFERISKSQNARTSRRR